MMLTPVLNTCSAAQHVSPSAPRVACRATLATTRLIHVFSFGGLSGYGTNRFASPRTRPLDLELSGFVPPPPSVRVGHPPPPRTDAGPKPAWTGACPVTTQQLVQAWHWLWACVVVVVVLFCLSVEVSCVWYHSNCTVHSSLNLRFRFYGVKWNHFLWTVQNQLGRVRVRRNNWFWLGIMSSCCCCFVGLFFIACYAMRWTLRMRFYWESMILLNYELPGPAWPGV